jgi:hypothetical protein
LSDAAEKVLPSEHGEEVNSPSALAAWAVRGMLPDELKDRAAGIARRVEGIIRAERAVDSNAPDRATLRPNTLKELRQSATMIRRWLPDSFPANENGQVHFVRCVMESVAAVIEQACTEYGVDAGLVAPAATIRLTKAERQSGLSRQRAAEGLIAQLPNDHDGRNTWLMNYGVGDEAKALREQRGLAFDERHQAAETVS